MSSCTEVKTLLGHKNLNFSIECLVSFVTNADARIKLLIFDDGSLTKDDKLKLQTSITDCIIISKTECDLIVEKNLSSFPASRKYRNLSVYSRKIFDIILYDNKSTLYIDSDIFFLKRFSLPDFGDVPVFMQDSQSAYSFKPSEYINIRYKIFPKINSGFFYMPIKNFDLSFIEKLITDKIIDKGFFKNIGWHEQTLWAFLASKKGSLMYFDKTQVKMATEALTLSSGAICVHLVSSFRNHFEYVKAFSAENNYNGNFELLQLNRARKPLTGFDYYAERVIKKLSRYVNL